jgi:N-acetylglucosamine kinase-like BadF-type ATPase
MTPPFSLGIDGGNAKTDVILGTADGHVLAFVRGPGSSPHTWACVARSRCWTS